MHITEGRMDGHTDIRTDPYCNAIKKFVMKFILPQHYPAGYTVNGYQALTIRRISGLKASSQTLDTTF